MPISINSDFSSLLSRAVYHIENPNYQTGTMLEEIPADVGRAYHGYKRGGIIEGAEKFRKETMAAAVWLFGIPAFNKIGTLICENLLHLPMDMDFSDAAKGNDAIGDTIRYLKGELKSNLDCSGIKKYAPMVLNKDTDEVIKNVKLAKNITSNLAVVLNCIAMGVIIPKINQALTRKKLKELDDKKAQTEQKSFDDFTKKTSKNNPSFKGGFGDFIGNITYLTENSNKFRLIITDVPMIIGRMITSRNKYEAFENMIIDAGSIYFYNFCAQHLQKGLRNLAQVPAINPMVAQTFINTDKDLVKSAMDNIKDTPLSVEELFNKDIANNIYSLSTFGKYGKINRFVSNDAIKNIDSEVFKYLKTLRSKMGYEQGKEFNFDLFVKEAKKYNAKNALFLALGLAAAVWGLASFIPKLAFRITTLLTGRNEFTGIAKYDDKKKDVNNS